MHIRTLILFLGFFGLVGFSVWWVDSAMPLWALIFTPSVTTTSDTTKNKSK